MIQALLVDCADIYGEPLSNLSPANPKNFVLTLVLEVGLVGEVGADNFVLYVCTPEWLDEVLRKSTFSSMWGYHHLIVTHYDAVALEAAIRERINAIYAESWEQIVSRVRLIGLWEYEDYGKSYDLM